MAGAPPVPPRGRPVNNQTQAPRSNSVGRQFARAAEDHTAQDPSSVHGWLTANDIEAKLKKTEDLGRRCANLAEDVKKHKALFDSIEADLKKATKTNDGLTITCNERSNEIKQLNIELFDMQMQLGLVIGPTHRFSEELAPTRNATMQEIVGTYTKECLESAQRTKDTASVVKHVDSNRPCLQVIVMTYNVARTSHLRNEIFDAAQAECARLAIHACVREGQDEDETALALGGVQVAIATPEMMLRLIRTNLLQMETVKVFVVDGVSKMIFADLKPIIDQVYESRYVKVPMLRITSSDTTKTTRSVREKLALGTIQHFYAGVGYACSEYSHLRHLHDSLGGSAYVLVICKGPSMATQLLKTLKSEWRYAVSCIHESMPPKQLEENIRLFNSGDTRWLVGTDVFAGEIDLRARVVVNYELPSTSLDYVNRIQHCGELGRKGVVINLVRETERKRTKHIETIFNCAMKEMPANIGNLLY